jgi:hypothetical protein
VYSRGNTWQKKASLKGCDIAWRSIADWGRAHAD